MNLTPDDLPLLTQIVSALLASGHYTGREYEGDVPYVFRDDFGPDRDKEELPFRYVYRAVEDADGILDQIKWATRERKRTLDEIAKEALQ